jgi:hypothetical protein
LHHRVKLLAFEQTGEDVLHASPGALLKRLKSLPLRRPSPGGRWRAGARGRPRRTRPSESGRQIQVLHHRAAEQVRHLRAWRVDLELPLRKLLLALPRIGLELRLVIALREFVALGIVWVSAAGLRATFGHHRDGHPAADDQITAGINSDTEDVVIAGKLLTVGFNKTASRPPWS